MDKIITRNLAGKKKGDKVCGKAKRVLSVKTIGISPNNKKIIKEIVEKAIG